MGKIWVATATRYKDEREVRAQLALRMVREARSGEIRVVIAESSPNELIPGLLAEAGADVIREDMGATMGAGRRQVLAHVQDMAAHDDAIVWMEPEKAPLVRSLPKICAQIFTGEADIVIPGRTEEGFASYPALQVHAERYGNAIFELCAKRRLDVWMGPRAMNACGVNYFLEYRGEYGDKWDSIFIPPLRAIHDGLAVNECTVQYRHPEEQTRAEERDLDTLIVKRVVQLHTLATALFAEAKKLGLVS